MLEAETVQKLNELSKGFKLLYVEDNDGLRNKALTIFNKLFSETFSAHDGQSGYEVFLEHKPEIVVTDINMPNVNGLEMVEKIKKIAPKTKFIVLSAYDDKDFLFTSIKLGIFHYLKKPVKIDELTEVLIECLESITEEENSSLFDSYIDDVVHFQKDLLALTYKDQLLFVNQMFLEFFNVENLYEFEIKYLNFGKVLLEHEGFLYDHDDINWFLEASKEANKLMHVKIADKEGVNKHFILKLYPLPNKKDKYILSLNDITELNLLSIFDEKANSLKLEEQKETILNLMNAIKQNGSKLKIHNYYQGLTITNTATIEKVQEGAVTIQTQYLQQKAAKFQGSILLASDLFPTVVLCDPLESINYEKQTISFSSMRFLDRNPTQRSTVRVVPQSDHKILMEFHDIKFNRDITIVDLSKDAIKFEIIALPAGLKVESILELEMVFPIEGNPLVVKSSAKVFKILEQEHSFYIIAMFEHSSESKKMLVNYVAKRQMNLIREFKGLKID